MLQFKGIAPLFSLMDRPVQGKLIQWPENSKFLVETFISLTKEKELSQEQFNNYGKK
jgi:hypothetical protein